MDNAATEKITHVTPFGNKVREYTWDDLQRRMKLRKPYTGKEDLNGKTLVVRHTWGIGDVLYSTPAIKAIKDKFPNCRLVYISAYPEILENNPAVDMNFHVKDFDDCLDLGDKLGDEIWYYVSYDTPLKGGYDYKTNLRTKPKLNEFMMALLSKNPNTLSGDERAFVDQASNTLITRYKMIAIDLYCKHLCVDPPEKSIYYYPTPEELDFARRFLAPLRKKFKKIVTLMPHSSTPFKDYPHWREVIRHTPWNYFWLILGGRHYPGETWVGNNIYDATAAFTLRQTAAIIIEGDICCSSDTGLLYTKAARGGKCIVTYGPHEPAPFLHHFPSAKGLRVPHLSKTPGMEGMCSVGCYIDTVSCRPQGGIPPCLNELDPEHVATVLYEHAEGK